MRQILFVFAALFATTLLTSFVLQKEEYGKAGYYADSLHGRKTASGEVYNKNELTCAHKTLPFGTRIKVTRLDNKKSVIVRVNDRGPYVEGYVVDLSRAAAEKIDLIKIGVTAVKIEIEGDSGTTAERNSLSSATNPLSPARYSDELQPVGQKNTLSSKNITNELFAVDLQTARKVGFGVQIITFYDADNVLPIVKKLQQDWPSLVLVNLVRDETYKKSTYRVMLGPFVDKKAAEVQRKAAVNKGNKGCFVVDLSEL